MKRKASLHEDAFRFLPADTSGEMVIDEPGRLQEGITDGRSEKPESSLFHIPAHGIGFGRGGGYFRQRMKRMDDRPAVGKEGQDVVAKAAELLLYGPEQPGIREGRANLEPVFHDAFVVHQPLHILVRHPRDLLDVEIAEGPAVSGPLAEDRQPAQSRLRALQHEKLEQRPVIRDRLSPLPVVVVCI